jgi:PleD family two-component response regulator
MPASVVTVSIAVACTIPSAESSAATLVRAAEEALSEAKIKGRDRVAVSSVLDYGLMD